MHTRNPKIQVLRGLAIIGVVLIHTCPAGMWQVTCRPFINYSVASFLFLSGYLTKIGNDNWSSFFKKRIDRVVLPYILWTILYSIASKNWSPIDIFINLLTAQSAAPMYYILVYIQFVLLTPLLGRLALSKYSWTGWLIAPISVLIFKYYPLFSDGTLNPYLRLMYGDSCLGWFTFYYLGILLGNNIIIVNYKTKSLLIAYLTAIILNIAEGYIWLQHGEANCGTQIKLSSFLTSTIFCLIAYKYIRSKRIETASKYLVFVGNYSFGIYLSHIMFMKILAYIPIYKELPFILNSTIVLLVSLLFAYCASRICNSNLNKYCGFH